MKKVKLLTVIGARPQIIKAAAISRAISNHFADKIEEVILHTGQHYDANMSQVFFDELGIPRPNETFSLKATSPEEQMLEMEKGIKRMIEVHHPHAVLVYGDTNSTYAGAKAGFDLKVPVLHIEAGLRSYNNEMPEERNRVYADSVSSMLFTPTETGYNNLIKEGYKPAANPPYSIQNPGIFHCGDVMYDNSMHFAELAMSKTNILSAHGIKAGEFILATIHRNTNTDIPENLNSIFSALQEITLTHNTKLILPLHPRTRKMMAQHLNPELKKRIAANRNFIICDPVSFLEMTALENTCKLVLTDSGGVQKEAFYFKKPCIVLRNETEWVELAECGAAIIAGTKQEKIIEAYNQLISNPPRNFPSYYGDAHAAEFIIKKVLENFSA